MAEVRAGWVLLGLAAVAGLAWYVARDPADPARERAHQARAERAAAEAEPTLYRWRDANGVLQITEDPPKGRPYERVPRDAPPAIEVRGDRE